MGIHVWIRTQHVMEPVLKECLNAMGNVMTSRSFHVVVSATLTQHTTKETTENVGRNVFVILSLVRGNAGKTILPVANINAKAILLIILKHTELVEIAAFPVPRLVMECVQRNTSSVEIEAA